MLQENLFSHPLRFFFTPLVCIYAPKTVSIEKFGKHLPIVFGFFEK
jgi:hypothetical protein